MGPQDKDEYIKRLEARLHAIAVAANWGHDSEVSLEETVAKLAVEHETLKSERLKFFGSQSQKLRDAEMRLMQAVGDAERYKLHNEHLQRERAAREAVDRLKSATSTTAPLPMLLVCPSCSERHIDDGEFAVNPHHTHACQACGMVWRPAIEPTIGVQFLPGFKNKS